MSSPAADSDVGDEGGTDDEGLLEAAIENAKAQRDVSLLHNPQVYKALGFKEPPAYSGIPSDYCL
jgi:hypothetical protein